MMRLSIRIEDSLHSHLDTISQVLGLSKNEIVRDLLVGYVLDIEKQPEYKRRYEEWMRRRTAKYEP